MARISAKQQILDEQQKRLEERTLLKNTVECANFVMQRMGLEVDAMGFVSRYDEDEEEQSELVFDGKKCKDMNSYINTGIEMAFDPYNNIKLCSGLIQYYINYYMGKDTNMMYISNKATNESGNLTVVFDTGATVTGNVYNKDTLKYVDMIALLDGGTPVDYITLKGMDADASMFKR